MSPLLQLAIYTARYNQFWIEDDDDIVSLILDGSIYYDPDKDQLYPNISDYLN